MTSVDELFKGLPSKRKLDPVRDPNQIYKSAKISANGTRNRHARVDEDDDVDDVEAGPDPPPADGEEADGDGDYGPALPRDAEDEDPGEDEEGRFFGSGMTRNEREVLDFVDAAEAQTKNETIDTAWLRRTALNLERRISRNAEQRARHADAPERFIASEADLDADLKALSVLAEHPALYPELARLGTAASIAGLLAHDNTDIAIDAVECICELTDEDVAAAEDEWGALVDALLEADLVSLLVSNLQRLDEAADEADRAGVYHVLNVVENLCSRASTAEAVGADDALLCWLLARVQAPERPVGQNKQYAAEVLAILAQSGAAARRALAGHNAPDALLQLVAAYRRRDPEKGGEEEEYVANLFEALTCLADEPEGKAGFVEAEGVELCLIMLKEGKMSRAPSLRLLDHAATNGPEVCARLVEAAGLKVVFTAFMKRAGDRTTAEHLLGVFSSLLRLLPANSAERIRVLAKFVEKGYEKTERLVALRREYATRMARVDEQIRGEQEGMGEDEREEREGDWFSRRLDAGLFTLQTIHVILAWLVAEDSGAGKKIKALLADRDETLGVIRSSLQEQIDGMDPDAENAQDTRDMLSTLIEFLQ